MYGEAHRTKFRFGLCNTVKDSLTPFEPQLYLNCQGYFMLVISSKTPTFPPKCVFCSTVSISLLLLMPPLLHCSRHNEVSSYMLRALYGSMFTQCNDHVDAWTQSWTFMVLRRVLVSGTITALAAVSPQRKDTIFGRPLRWMQGGSKDVRDL